jgi:Met-zincin/Domain of unknown function (DUF5117)/Domain of unknown function (DUF5118)
MMRYGGLIFVVYLVFLGSLYAQVSPQAMESNRRVDTAIDVDIRIDTVILEPETPSSVPLGNEPLSEPLHYHRIIKANAITRKGLFTVHKVDDKYYFEIPDSLLGRDMLVVSRISQGAAGVRPGYSGFAGDQIGTTVIRFEKGPSDNLFLRRISFADNIGDSTNTMFNALIRSNLQPLAASFEISAYTPDKRGSVIDVTNYLNGDNDILFFSPGTKQQMDVGRMLSEMCYIKDVQTFPLNIEIRTIKTYEQANTNGRSFTWELNTSILLLPDKPMRIRMSDRRVGYYTDRYTDYSTGQGVEVVSYIKRWRLEPKPEDAEKYARGQLVEPAKPIVFYVDPATPRKWIPYIIRGVNDWQEAFQAAGFKNAIMAKEAPSKQEDPTWNLQDSRHSVIVYKPSAWANATGHIITDPRSGEILESHVNFYHNINSLLRTWYMVQCGPIDKRAQKLDFDDELMGGLIRSVVCHETGHALGLLHNLGASSTVPVERLRDKNWLESHGLCPSIMDYARFNYVAQPEDSVGIEGLVGRIGEYDRWAIEWGYRLFPSIPLDSEKARLDSRIIEEMDDQYVWFGSEFASDDPRTQAEDLGDNAMKASTYGIKNLQRVVPNLLKWGYRSGESYKGLAEVYSGVEEQYLKYLQHVAHYIGGTYESHKTYDQPGAVYLPVPAYLQRNAMLFLADKIFKTPKWLLDSAIQSRVGRSPLQVIGKLQDNVLSELIGVGTLSELLNAESMYGNRVYSLESFFYDLDRSVWGELKNYSPIDMFRRMLQQNYVERLLKILDPSTLGKGKSDIAPQVVSQLKSLRERMRKAIRKSQDQPTRIHLQYLVDEMNKVLPVP